MWCVLVYALAGKRFVCVVLVCLLGRPGARWRPDGCFGCESGQISGILHFLIAKLSPLTSQRLSPSDVKLTLGTALGRDEWVPRLMGRVSVTAPVPCYVVCAVRLAQVAAGLTTC